MSNPKYLFQYCQKLVVLNEQLDKVLLAKRKGEADYDGAFSFVGGKMETTDDGLIAGLKREKNEELGKSVRLSVYPPSTNNAFFRKSDGSSMILPHYLAYYTSGEIDLNQDEYSEYRWVPLNQLNGLKPIIENIPATVDWAINLSRNAKKNDFVEI